MASLQAFFVRQIIKHRVNPKIDVNRHDVQTIRQNVKKLVKHHDLLIDTKTRSVELTGREEISGVMVEANGAIDNKNKQCILYIHAGGFFLPLDKSHLKFSEQLSIQTNLPVFCVDYTNSPEKPHPAAQNDCVRAYHYLLKQGFENIIVVGDSAGGALALLAQRHFSTPAQALLLLSLCCGDAAHVDGAYYELIPKEDSLGDKAAQRKCSEMYFPNRAVNAVDVPLNINTALFIQLGSEEVGRVQSEYLHQRAIDMGMNSQLHIWPNMWHNFQTLSDYMPEAKRACVQIGGFVKSLPTKTNAKKNELV